MLQRAAIEKVRHLFDSQVDWAAWFPHQTLRITVNETIAKINDLSSHLILGTKKPTPEKVGFFVECYIVRLEV
ncbi:hypothetical protein Sbal117_4857 (plasmid) [Shewanella baltica OS117]|nr:hypothetical protein Sbal117_4857 [Shewanella baltica OS117]